MRSKKRKSVLNSKKIIVKEMAQQVKDMQEGRKLAEKMKEQLASMPYSPAANRMILGGIGMIGSLLSVNPNERKTFFNASSQLFAEAMTAYGVENELKKTPLSDDKINTHLKNSLDSKIKKD